MKKILTYYVSVKELYGDDYIKQFVDNRYAELFEQLSIQFKQEISKKELSIVIIPITSGIERLEILTII